jgi:ribosomal protein L19E
MRASTSDKLKGNREHKTVEIFQLALYCNPLTDAVGSTSMELGKNRLFSSLRQETAEDTNDQIIYFLRPTNVFLKLMVNKNLSSEEQNHQYAAVINVDNLSIVLDDNQLQAVLSVSDAISLSRAQKRYKERQPQASQRGKPGSSGWQKKLWMFAIKAVLSDVHKRLSHLSANYIVWRREYRKRYMALYLAKLENLQHGQVSNDHNMILNFESEITNVCD